MVKQKFIAAEMRTYTKKILWLSILLKKLACLVHHDKNLDSEDWPDKCSQNQEGDTKQFTEINGMRQEDLNVSQGNKLSVILYSFRSTSKSSKIPFCFHQISKFDIRLTFLSSGYF